MNIKFNINEDLNEIFEEKGNTYSAIRKVSWGEKEKEYIDIRKWYAGEDGDTPGKGFCFSTEDGPDELVNVMLKKGFGETEEVLESIKDREDFKQSLSKVLSDEEAEELGIELSEIEEQFHDPSDIFE